MSTPHPKPTRDYPEIHLSTPELESIAFELSDQWWSPANIALHTAVRVLQIFLGDKWVESNVMANPPPKTAGRAEDRQFISMGIPPIALSDAGDEIRRRSRIVRLAQCVFALQHAPGFAHRLEMLRVENLEAAAGELDAASLFAPNAGFRFIVPSGVKGADYEAEFVTAEGRTVCCEIKTKCNSTSLSEQTVWSTIDHARKQLPKGVPGIVAVRIPEHWVTDDGSRAMVAAIEKAQRQSERLVAVIVAWEKWMIDGEWWGCDQNYSTVFNEKSSLCTQDIVDAIKTAGKRHLAFYIDFTRLALRAIAAIPSYFLPPIVKILIEGLDQLPDWLDSQGDDR